MRFIGWTMALDDLLARLEHAAGTVGTSHVPAAVPANPLRTLGRTSGTFRTAENDKVTGEVREPLPTDTAPPIRETRRLLRYADEGGPMQVLLPPAADHADELAAYPDAAAAEPPLELSRPAGNEIRRGTAARGCSTCRYCMRPGLSAGYCGGGRDDLAPAYGMNHPLRQLPASHGEDCATYRSHEE